MSDNILSLHGAPAPQTGKANATVVEELERLLAAARAGEIVGLAGSYVHGNGVVTYSYAGMVGGYALVGGLNASRNA